MKEILKQARIEKKISTRKLSEITNIDQALISKFENGIRIPTKNQIQLLAKFLNIDLSNLLVAWYKEKLLHSIEFNIQSIQAVTEILQEKGIELKTKNKKDLQISAILSEIDNLKNKLSNL